MKRALATICCMIMAITLMAGGVARYNPSGDPGLDNLILRININYNQLQNEQIGSLDIDVYHTGISECDRQTWLGRLLRNIIPFQGSRKRDYALEALSHVSYQWPGDVQYNTVSLRANSKRHAKMMLNEAYKCLLPIYDMRREGADTRSFAIPFTDEGLRQYYFSYLHEDADTLFAKSRPNLCRIAFWPTSNHHTLLSGEMLVDTLSLDVVSLQWRGRIDFAKAEGQIDFAIDSATQIAFPTSSITQIRYNWLGAKGTNRYISNFKFNRYKKLDEINRWHQPLDLTSVYQVEPLKEANFDTIRTAPISAFLDSILTPRPKAQPEPIDTILETPVTEELITLATGLVEGAKLGDEQNRIRIYGPLDPASFGYNKLDGITIREKFRWDRDYKNGSFLQFRGNVGFAFRQKELRYQSVLDWNYKPETRRKLTFEANRFNSGFSSKFIKTVNEAIKEDYRYPDSINFNSLGVEYYRHYQFLIEHSNEVANGLMLYVGASYNYRDPVKHGERAIKQRDDLIKSHYGDFSPYVRLEWTPRQYYVMEGRRKIYVSSPSPTFSIEAAKAIPNVLGAESDYSRLEADVHQDIRIRPSRVFAYHIGAGTFLRQRGEYFVKYRYFSHHMYTSQEVEDRLGGAFQLLDDYWYSSSASYFQTHMMFATPFGIMHSIPLLSKYAIQERFYLGNLWADGKKGLYTEFGYGFSNNYFSLGVFTGFTKLKYYSTGIKFSIEIGDHL